MKGGAILFYVIYYNMNTGFKVKGVLSSCTFYQALEYMKIVGCVPSDGTYGIYEIVDVDNNTIYTYGRSKGIFQLRKKIEDSQLVSTYTNLVHSQLSI